MHQERFVDCIVVGAGLAGASAACALSGLGYRVLVVDAGVDHTPRLGGELIHPIGVAHLRVLGLFDPLVRAGGIPVRGFAVFSSHDRTDPSSTAARLDYPETCPSSRGLAVERGAMMRALWNALSHRRGVDFWQPARLIRVHLRNERLATVTVSCRGVESELTTRLLVAADGRNSFVRKNTRIRVKESRISVMFGYQIAASAIPCPGYGHIFVGGPAPVLAYELGVGGIRLMIDVPGSTARSLSPREFTSYARALTPGLCEGAQEAMAKQIPLAAPTHWMVTEASARGCVAFVGDAAGCCHPLTASGLSFSTCDALWLKEALCGADGNIPAALTIYSALRLKSQRTRFLLADLLYSALSARTPGKRLLCSGMLRYWQSSEKARETSMALLASNETRLRVAAVELLNCASHALPALWSWPANPYSLGERGHALIDLLSDSLRFMFSAARP